jgi:acyl-homoserine-lactone acylase
VYGTSYIQTVMFDAAGPQAQAFLTFSQSSNPKSPHHADQTERFSKNEWITQAFTEAQITGDANYRTMSISE